MSSAVAARSSENSGFAEVISRDPDEVVQLLSSHLAPHRMLPRESRSIHARVGTLPLDSALLVDLSYGAEVDIHASAFTDVYLVHALIAGRSEMSVGNRPILVHEGNVPISSVGMEPWFRMGARGRHLTLRITRSALESHFSAALGTALTHPVVFDPQTPAYPRFSEAWRDLLAHVVEQAALVPRLMLGKRMQSHYLAIALEMLMRGTVHTYSHLLAREPQVATSFWYVRRACEMIESSLGEPLSVSCIASTLGVSARSLQNGFRRSLGVTPVQYIRDRRLERLNASLLSADPTSSVTDLMLACGIVNFGRFARHYRQRFGRTPSQTLYGGKA